MERDRRPQRSPAWLPKVLLSLVACLLTISAILGVTTYRFATRPVRLEVLSTAARRQLIEQSNRLVPPIYQPFPLSGPLLFYHMTPHTEYVNVLGGTFTTNDLGFRAAPTSPKPEGARRIVIVGDSWTFGQGVEAGETFSSQLEKLLNRQGAKWQVYNLGMPGWNTANAIAALRTLLSRLQPDAIVFCPTSNDIDDSYDIWNGRLVNRGFSFGAGFRHSYAYQSRWVQAFQSLQTEVDVLKRRGTPSLIYFLAEWRTLAPYYAKLSGLHVPYTVVPTEYIGAKYRLGPDVDPGQHATPQGHQLIAAYLHNALVEQQMVAGLEPLPLEHRVVFPAHAYDRAAVEAEFKWWEPRLPQRPDLMPLIGDYMGRQGLFSVPASAQARTVYARLKLIDDPGLYPLTVEIRLESAERISVTKVFDRFLPHIQTIAVAKPKSLDIFPIVEVHVIADHVVLPKDWTPVSMQRPTFDVR